MTRIECAQDVFDTELKKGDRIELEILEPGLKIPGEVKFCGLYKDGSGIYIRHNDKDRYMFTWGEIAKITPLEK